MTEHTNVFELYKAQTNDFTDDFDYYSELCANKTTLELFAGYGRLTNFLQKNNIDVAAVEIESEYAKYLTIPKDKIYIDDVLKFQSPRRYQRIIAAYNSFCLITKDEDIFKLFQNIDAHLENGGFVSLSYYDYNYLEGGYETVFKYLGKDVIYRPTCDLSLRNKKLGTWTDRYYFDSKSIDFSLQTRLYENIDEIAPFLKDTNLTISETVTDYRRQDIYPGWLEFTLTKK